MRKTFKATLIFMLAWLGIAVSGIAMAQHHGGHGGGHSGGYARFGVYIGAPYYGSAYYPYYSPAYYSPAYYPSTYYSAPYYPPVAAAPYAPPAYVENGAPPAPAYAPQAQQNWWYYCAQSRTYYPYVKQCAGAWQRVPAQPPNG
jgi:hypothetical protein